MKTKKTKRNVWTDPSPYGTYEGERGSPSQWRAEFDQRFSREEALNILRSDNPYVVLGISNTATTSEIKVAFRNLMFQHHPDRGGKTETAQKIIAAYQYLTN